VSYCIPFAAFDPRGLTSSYRRNGGVSPRRLRNGYVRVSAREGKLGEFGFIRTTSARLLTMSNPLLAQDNLILSVGEFTAIFRARTTPLLQTRITWFTTPRRLTPARSRVVLLSSESTFESVPAPMIVEP